MTAMGSVHANKGIGDLISLVLIIGLSITLAAIVGNWAIKYSQRFEPEKIAAPELYCDNVGLSVEGDCYFQIKNKGSRKIDTLLIRATKAEETKIEEITGMLPNQLTTISACSYNADEIEIIPKVKGEKEIVTCIEKAYIINKDILSKCVC